MRHLLISIAHYLCVAFGAILLYFTYTTTEQEEGVWTNRLEAAWVKIDDRSKNVRSTSLALFESVSIVVERALTRLYGAKLFSPRILVVSYMLSIAAWFCLAGVVLIPAQAFTTLTDPSWENVRVLLGGIVLLFGITFLYLWIARLMLRSVYFQILGFLVFFLPSLVRGLKDSSELGQFVLMVVAAIVNVALIAAVRKTLQWIAHDVSTRRIAVALIVQFVIVSVLVGVPLLVAFKTDLERPSQQSIFLFGLMSVSTALAALSLGVAVALLLSHRIVWPLLSRWAYVFTRPEILDKRKLVRTLGWSCVSSILAGNHAINIFRKLLD